MCQDAACQPWAQLLRGPHPLCPLLGTRFGEVLNPCVNSGTSDQKDQRDHGGGAHKERRGPTSQPPCQPADSRCGSVHLQDHDGGCCLGGLHSKTTTTLRNSDTYSPVPPIIQKLLGDLGQWCIPAAVSSTHRWMVPGPMQGQAQSA